MRTGACERKKHGALEEYLLAPAERKQGKETSNVQPKYYRVGKATLPDGKPTGVKDQTKIIRAIQADGRGAATLNEESIERRQQGWKDWANRTGSAAGKGFPGT